MHVIINGIPLLAPKSGVGNYVYQTSKALLDININLDLSFYYGIEWSDHLKEQPIEPYVSARKFIQQYRLIYPVYRRTLDLLFYWGQFRKKYNLYHETNYVPMRFDGPTVVTIFDLSFYFYPETHPKERIRYMERYFYPRLDRANHFITISEATKRDLVKQLNLPEEKITVTPLGVDDSFKPFSPNTENLILSKYGLKHGSYVLSVGTLEPRKNIVTLLNAYAELPSVLRNRFPLVLAGGVGWLMEDLEKKIQGLGIKSTTYITGYIPKSDLPSLYGGATVFVYPSIYEGFGLPVLEAMACGTPVITSNTSSLPEVLGSAGILIDPHNVSQLTREMENLLTNPVQRDLLTQAGIKRAKIFTWEKCASKTLDVYNHVVKN